MEEPRWAVGAQEDTIGMDRLARSLLRLIARMPPGSLVAVHGAPGSGKEEFVRRVAWLTASGRSRGAEVVPGIHGGVAWFDAWRWAKQGNLLAGFVSSVVLASDNPAPLREKARSVLEPILRLRWDGQTPDGSGAAFGASADPVVDLARNFRALVELVKAARPGRLVAIVEGLDALSPALRWQVLDGLRLVLGEAPDLTVVLSVGRESALDAVTWFHGEIPPASAARVFEEMVDLTLTIPNLDVRRIGTLLREYVGNSEAALRRSFGNEAFIGLSAAAAHRPLGSPRFLRRLAWRAVMLAEYAAEVRSNRPLTEAQWAWVIISERWPEFRRTMIRGGRPRWVELAHAVAQLKEDRGGPARPGVPVAVRSGIAAWLEDDTILASYLQLHADGFAQDAEGIFWLENLMLSAGL